MRTPLGPRYIPCTYMDPLGTLSPLTNPEGIGGSEVAPTPPQAGLRDCYVGGCQNQGLGFRI